MHVSQNFKFTFFTKVILETGQRQTLEKNTLKRTEKSTSIEACNREIERNK